MIKRQIEVKKEPGERMMIKRQIAVSFTRRKKRKTGNRTSYVKKIKQSSLYKREV